MNTPDADADPTGPEILPFRAADPGPRPYFVHRRTYDVGGVRLMHVAAWWDAGACPDPDAMPLPHRDDVVMTTLLSDPVSGTIYRPAAPGPAAASH